MTYRGEHRDGGARSLQFADSTTSVLLKANAVGGHGETICQELLAGGTPTDRNVLAIDFRRSADQWIQAWKDDVGTLPNALRLIVMEDAYRSASTLEPDSTAVDYEISPIDNPQDLTAIGIELTDCLEQWEDDTQTVLACVDSLSTMLQYMSLKSVFRFLHVFIRQLEAFGATGHFHIDPSAHDERTMARLRQLFDAVVTVNGDSTVSVQER